MSGNSEYCVRATTVLTYHTLRHISQRFRFDPLFKNIFGLLVELKYENLKPREIEEVYGLHIHNNSFKNLHVYLNIIFNTIKVFFFYVFIW